MVDVAIIGL